MSDAPLKRCLVAVDTAQGVRTCELQLQVQATIAQALLLARPLLGEVVAWESASVGIFGRACTREVIPQAGDRIELYRALLADPRERRRQNSRLGARRAQAR